ncbi:MAG: hypothetical protein HYR56_17150 [Acidobacteria bacterium]|nr:hypothetical protein [Acidobacteriota bacterium]MBI3421613.1 hypothetical protein [Acidobacteriota bacterium]
MRTSFLKRLIARMRGRDLEAEYQVWLRQFGRITEGRVVETLPELDGGLTIFFHYSLANVQYETSYRLNDEQMERQHKYVPGASITVRYDPRSPGSSMIE